MTLGLITASLTRATPGDGGAVTLEPTAPVLRRASGLELPGQTVRLSELRTGRLLQATDDPGLTPSPWQWRATFSIPGLPLAPVIFDLPASGRVDLFDLVSLALAPSVIEVVSDADRRRAEAAADRAEAAADSISDGNGGVGIRGPQGEPGRDGIDGVDGAPGRDGIDGQRGADGAPGRDGLDGAPGLPGTAGTNGLDGKQGERGLPGADGAPGRDGANGTNGADGQRGLPGADGTPGKDGAAGTAGTNGTNGAPGVKGDPGATGPQGPAGNVRLLAAGATSGPTTDPAGTLWVYRA